MNIIDLINKKRNKKELTKQEIDFFVDGYVNHQILEEQASALLMAICLKGMSREETLYLTQAMANSGEQVNLSELYENKENLCVDKHSSGGVSDTTTLVIAALLASCDVKMLKMSGRSLGFTGGTADKIEEFTGYQAEKSMEEAIEIVKKHSVSLITQTKKIVPADKKLYALRDRTGTVESIPLIASSIMSKKLASGNGILLLDVKCGNGAFMKTPYEAKRLAKTMVRIGNDAGLVTAAFVTDMSQPLGTCIGNRMEAKEAVDVLKWHKKGRLTTLCLQEAAYLVAKAKKIEFEVALMWLKKNLESGLAYQCFENIIHAHGGIIPVFEIAKAQAKVFAQSEGMVSGFATAEIGLLAHEMDKQDKGGGIELFVEIGSKVKVGDLLAVVYHTNNESAQSYADQLQSYISVSSLVIPPKLIYHVITK